MQRTSYSRPIYLEDGASKILLRFNCSMCPVNIPALDQEILFDVASREDDLLGLDHVNKSRNQFHKGDSIFIR